MSNPLARKLLHFAPLPEEDLHLLEELVRAPRSHGAGTSLVREGEATHEVPLILEGFACRYKLLANGQRHIMAYLLPGDLGDLNADLLGAMDHGIATLGPARVVGITRTQVQTLGARPALARALGWAALVDAGTSREWLVNLGQREAEARLAHLLCELHLRLDSVGLAPGGRFQLPVTQLDLADTLGLTSVHVNRVLQRLREKALITLRGREVVVHDAERLRVLGGFNPNYLHLARAGSMTTQNRTRT